MAATVIKVRRIKQTDSGNLTGDKQGEKHEYLVEFSERPESLFPAYAADDGSLAVPAMGAALAGSAMLLASKDADRVPENPRLVKVTCNYEYSQGSNQERPSDSAEVWNVQMEVRTVVTKEPVYKARLDPAALTNTYAIENSAGQPFATAVTEDFYDEEVRLKFRAIPAKIDPDVLATCRGRINAVTVTFIVAGVDFTWSQYAAKCIDVAYRPVYESTGTYWEVELAFGVRSPDWATRILDQGRLQLEPGGTKGYADLVPILDKNREPVTVDCYLDGGGHQSKTPYWLTFWIPLGGDIQGLLDGFGIG